MQSNRFAQGEAAMVPRIRKPETTAFFGKRMMRRELAERRHRERFDPIDVRLVLRTPYCIAALWQQEVPGRSYPSASLKPTHKRTRKGNVVAAS